MVDGELFYHKILDVNLFAFAYYFMKISLQSAGRICIFLYTKILEVCSHLPIFLYLIGVATLVFAHTFVCFSS